MHNYVQPLCVFLFFALCSVLPAAATKTSCARNWSYRPQSEDYSVNSNVWNQGKKGSQCIAVPLDAKQFDVTWFWKDDWNSVRSYPHVKFYSRDLPAKLSNISNLSVAGAWSAKASDGKGSDKARSLDSIKARFNVAIDMFLHEDPKSAQNATTARYEIMVWVGANLQPRPLGYSNGVKMVQKTDNHSFSLYSGQNHRGISTFSWLIESDLYDFNLDLLDLIIPLVQKEWIPYQTYLGLVELGTETYYSNNNVTFAVRDFAMSLNTTSGPVLLDIPEPDVPGTAPCLQFGFLHRLHVLAMIGLSYLYCHM